MSMSMSMSIYITHYRSVRRILLKQVRLHWANEAGDAEFWQAEYTRWPKKSKPLSLIIIKSY